MEVDLHLTPQVPPARLYHGTWHGVTGAIQREGLRRMQRQHVRLSEDLETARRVGMRRGPVVIFVIDAQALARDGISFYRSENGIWLVNAVPPQYLRRLRIRAILCWLA